MVSDAPLSHFYPVTTVVLMLVLRSMHARTHELGKTIKQLCPHVDPRVASSREILIAVCGHFASEIEGGHLDPSRKDNAALFVTIKMTFFPFSLSCCRIFSLFQPNHPFASSLSSDISVHTFANHRMSLTRPPWRVHPRRNYTGNVSRLSLEN